jgi:hypothetical protein
MVDSKWMRGIICALVIRRIIRPKRRRMDDKDEVATAPKNNSVRKRRLSGRAIVGSIAICLAALAWILGYNMFSRATKPIPVMGSFEEDDIALNVPTTVSRGDISLAVARPSISGSERHTGEYPYYIRIEMRTLENRGCIPFAIEGRGESILINPQSESVRLEQYIARARDFRGIPLWYDVQRIRGEVCEPKPIRGLSDRAIKYYRYTATIKFHGMRGLMFGSSSTATFYSVPAVTVREAGVTPARMRLLPLDSQEWDDLGGDQLDESFCTTHIPGDLSITEQLEVSIPSSEDKDYLTWDECGGRPKKGMITDGQRQEDASSNLFISGALIGAVFSFALFGVECLIDAFHASAGWRDSNPHSQPVRRGTNPA